MYAPEKSYKKEIFELIAATWDSPYISVSKDTYSIFEKKFSYPEVDHTDGIGTKGMYHWKARTFRSAVIDALAMNLNDLALVRAVPYKMQNHIVLPADDHGAILEIVRALVEESKKRTIAITGGETSIHEGGEMDISNTMSGFVKNRKPNAMQVGDVLIGIASSGLHSNGFTRVREKFGDEVRKEFTEPTAIYLETTLDINSRFDIHGMMHITGGAFTKLKDVLDGADAEMYRDYLLQPQEIFKELYRRGVSDEEMYTIFNCGIGFILSASKADADRIVREVEKSAIIGRVVAGTGKVKIESVFSDKKIEF